MQMVAPSTLPNDVNMVKTNDYVKTLIVVEVGDSVRNMGNVRGSVGTLNVREVKISVSNMEKIKSTV